MIYVASSLKLGERGSVQCVQGFSYMLLSSSLGYCRSVLEIYVNKGFILGTPWVVKTQKDAKQQLIAIDENFQQVLSFCFYMDNLPYPILCCKSCHTLTGLCDSEDARQLSHLLLL